MAKNKVLSIVAVLFLIVSLTLLPVAYAQPEEEEMDMNEMMELMMGMFMELEVDVITGDFNLMTDSATIYIQLSQSGLPINATSLNVTLIYDDPCNWVTVDCEEGTPPQFFGYWEYDNETCDPDPSIDICDYIWTGDTDDPDCDGNPVEEDEKINIPGLYVVTVCYGGFLPGDYMIFAYAEAPMLFGAFMGGFTGENGTDMGEFTDMFGNMTSRGIGVGGFTVNEDLTIAAKTIIAAFPELVAGFELLANATIEGFTALEEEAFPELVACMQQMGASMGAMMHDMEGLWHDLGVNLDDMMSNMDGLMGFMDEMVAYQEEMGANVGDMVAFQDEMVAYQEEMVAKFEGIVSGLDSFQESMDLAQSLIDELLTEVSYVKADVGETIATLPVLYQEATEVTKMTAVGIPIAQALAGAAVVFSLISAVLLVRLNGRKT